MTKFDFKIRLREGKINALNNDTPPQSYEEHERREEFHRRPQRDDYVEDQVGDLRRYSAVRRRLWQIPMAAPPGLVPLQRGIRRSVLLAVLPHPRATRTLVQDR